MALAVLFGGFAQAQVQVQGMPGAPPPAPAARSHNVPQTPVKRPNNLRRDETEIEAVDRQTMDGPWFHLRVKARVETSEVRITADEIDYNKETGDAEARGNVKFERFATNEILWADRVDYNVTDETGKFFNVHGSAPIQTAPRPFMLKTTNPFYFQGKWAERIEDRYILHDGFVTNCKVPKPWWVLRAPTFDIIPNERAVAYRGVFRLKRVPLFYAPVLYKSLEPEPRQSGFLSPNIGNSSTRGKMIGVGYYWAINRSYDATYRAQYFTQRGLAHRVDFRGKPTRTSDFNFYLYGVNDRGLEQPNGTRIKQGGFLANFKGNADLGHGFEAKVDANYLSSFVFRQAFSESFNEWILSEVHSIGYVDKQWSYNSLNFIVERNENFQSASPGDTIVIRKLPEVDFSTRDRLIWDRGIPIWLSLDSSAGLLRRTQPLFQTRAFMDRLDFEPRVLTAVQWKGFSLVPSFSLRESHWGSSQQDNQINGLDASRSAREFSVALIPPSLERVFKSPKWLGGDKLKHVIEPRVSYRKVSGVHNFNELVKFDNTELLTNTSEAQFSLVNRIYIKRGNAVSELLSWELAQERYFDPTFGGAVLPGQRNVILSSVELTPYAFLNGPRRYSPIVSSLKLYPKPGYAVEWRTDYDPLRKKFTVSEISASVFKGIFGASVRNTMVSPVLLGGPANTVANTATNYCNPAPGQILPLLSPCANQFSASFSAGHDYRKGWNASVSEISDFRLGSLQWLFGTVTYNTDCCGFSVQYYRRFNPAGPSDNVYRFSLTLANITSFGNLRPQQKFF